MLVNRWIPQYLTSHNTLSKSNQSPQNYIPHASITNVQSVKTNLTENYWYNIPAYKKYSKRTLRFKICRFGIKINSSLQGQRMDVAANTKKFPLDCRTPAFVNFVGAWCQPCFMVNLCKAHFVDLLLYNQMRIYWLPCNDRKFNYLINHIQAYWNSRYIALIFNTTNMIHCPKIIWQIEQENWNFDSAIWPLYHKKICF